jgi:hypothetical protein
LESLDRTNFTQHKFARASYGIKGRQPCSAPDNDDEELSPEEIRMLQLDPTAQKIYDKRLQRFLFKKDVNDWFAKLVCISLIFFLILWTDNTVPNISLLQHDPLIWNPENFVWRDQVVRC